MKVVEFTPRKINPDTVLKEAKGMLESVIIVGVTKDGDHYFASSTKKNETLWLVEKFKQTLLEEVE